MCALGKVCLGKGVPWKLCILGNVCLGKCMPWERCLCLGKGVCALRKEFVLWRRWLQTWKGVCAFGKGVPVPPQGVFTLLERGVLCLVKKCMSVLPHEINVFNLVTCVCAFSKNCCDRETGRWELWVVEIESYCDLGKSGSRLSRKNTFRETTVIMGSRSWELNCYNNCGTGFVLQYSWTNFYVNLNHSMGVWSSW